MKQIFFALILPALISCVSIDADNSYFTSMEKYGNTIVLKTANSSTEFVLAPVQTASVEKARDTLCVNTLDDIYFDLAFITLNSFEDGKQVKTLKNLFVEEKKIGATLYVPYQNTIGFSETIKIHFDFLRETPYLKGNSNIFYPIDFDINVRFVVLPQNPEQTLPNNDIECEFGITLKEENEQIGQFVLTRVFSYKNNDSGVILNPWEDFGHEITF